MAFSQLQLTNVGTRELAKGQALTITKVALGGAQISNVATATNLAQKVCEVVPTTTTDGDYRVIEAVFDNVALNVTTEKQIQEVGVFGKVGNGTEVLIYYAKGSAFTFPSKTQQQMTVKLPFRVRITGAPEVRVEINTQLSGVATSDSVNRLSDKLEKLKTGTASDIKQGLNIEPLLSVLGTVAKRAPADIDTLGNPGLYMFDSAHNFRSKGIASDYGFILVYSNQNAELGSDRNFTWQLIIGTNGLFYLRRRINRESWQTIRMAGTDMLLPILKRLGLNELGHNSMLECPQGTSFGNYLKTDTVPVGFNIIRDRNSPAKDVYVWKSSNTNACCFSPGYDEIFRIASLKNGVWGDWRDLGQTIKVASNASTQDFGDYLKSSAVPIGVSAQRDARSGAFGQVTKLDNNNVYFNGTVRKGGKTYQAVYSIVSGVKPSGFTETALTP